MPPHIPRKRLRSSSSSSSPKTTPNSRPKGKALIAPPRKPTLFDDLDAISSPGHSSRSKLLEIQDSEDDQDSPLSSLSDLDFEDVPGLFSSKRQKTGAYTSQQLPDDDDDEFEDEDIEFEDVETHPLPPHTFVPTSDVPISGDLELTLIRDTRISLTNDAALLGKRGPSKLERQIRVSTHCVHVLLLMWHNALRNAWACDPEVQGLLLSHLPPRLWDEVDRWRTASGLVAEEVEEISNKKGKGKKIPGKKGKEVKRETRSRDWGKAAERLEKGAIDRSQGDPLYRLMKILSAWWKKRFRVTAPGLRKWGYMSLERLDRLTKAFKEEEGSPAEKFGEKIQNLDEFRKCAQECAGSRDVGAQLFTALLRGLGLEARMVASLQPLGIGWNKLEEADPEKENLPTSTSTGTPKKDTTKKPSTSRPPSAKSTKPTTSSSRRTTRKSTTTLDSDLQISNSDDDSILDIPSPSPHPAPKTHPLAPSKPYDKDLEYPYYWTEVLSPVQQKYIPVDALVRSIIGTNPELVQSLEPRGAKADKAKQGVSYILGYSPDGTAKDVTVRYLKRRVYPGRTKGNRMPVEKIAVYNRNGKVKRYDLWDWFREGVMRGYARGGAKCPVTEVDEEEDREDLKPAEVVRKEVKEGEETLQFFKTSKEFVLERHLKREEALLPGAKVVRYFNGGKRGKGKGKGFDGEGEAEGEAVYLRSDVVMVKSAETWHKQGRAPIRGEQPLKRVPYRAATTNRRREIAEAELATGAKVLQGLYSFDQTEWIIPEPIVDGRIPKNEYGNIDLFAEHMCPAGAVHVPYRGAMRAAKKLGVDYAEAVVDFEFGNRMAVPVIQGVVVAAEEEGRVLEELRRDEEDRRRKEDEKKRKAVLGMWRKMCLGLRIVERLKGYGDFEAEESRGGVFGDRDRDRGQGGGGFVVEDEGGDEGGGGFIPEGYELEEEAGDDGGNKMQLTSGFFPTVLSDEEGEDGEDDTLMIDHGEGVAGIREPSPEPAPAMKGKGKGKSVMSTKPTRKGASAAKSKTRAVNGGLRRRRPNVVSSSEGEEDEEDSDDGDEDGDVYMNEDE